MALGENLIHHGECSKSILHMVLMVLGTYHLIKRVYWLVEGREEMDSRYGRKWALVFSKFFLPPQSPFFFFSSPSDLEFYHNLFNNRMIRKQTNTTSSIYTLALLTSYQCFPPAVTIITHTCFSNLWSGSWMFVLQNYPSFCGDKN